MLLHLFRVTWGQSAHEAFCGLVSLNAVDHNLIHIATVKVANGAFDYVAFFIHQGRGLACEGFFADFVPSPHEVFVVSTDFRLAAFGSCCPHNHGNAAWDLDLR